MIVIGCVIQAAPAQYGGGFAPPKPSGTPPAADPPAPDPTPSMEPDPSEVEEPQAPPSKVAPATPTAPASPAAPASPTSPTSPDAKSQPTRVECTAPPKGWIARLNPEDRTAIEAGLGYALPPRTPQVVWVGEHATASEPHLAGTIVVIQSFDSNSNGSSTVDKLVSALGDLATDPRVVVIGVQIPIKVEATTKRLAKSTSKANLCVDQDGSWCDALGAFKKPINIVVDRNGAIRYAGLTEKGVAAAAKLLLDEPVVARTPLARPVETASASTTPVAFPTFTSPLNGCTDLRGKASPPLVVDQWITAKPNNDGKVTLVDFFFTGCPPCRAAIPHLNEIASHYKDSVAVVGVSFETKSTFEEGLRKHRLKENDFKYSIGLDTSRRTIGGFGVSSYPSIAIISSDGVVRWQGHPSALTPAVIDPIVLANQQLAAQSQPVGDTTRGWAK